MSIVTRCDWCGEEIPPAAPTSAFQTHADVKADHTSGWIGHYHDGHWRNEHGQVEGRACFTRMLDAVRLVHDFAPAALENVEVATPQKIAQLRRRHRTHTDQDAA